MEVCGCERRENRRVLLAPLATNQHRPCWGMVGHEACGARFMAWSTRRGHELKLLRFARNGRAWVARCARNSRDGQNVRPPLACGASLTGMARARGARFARSSQQGCLSCSLRSQQERGLDCSLRSQQKTVPRWSGTSSLRRKPDGNGRGGEATAGILSGAEKMRGF